jgi:hypothetical protein
VHGSASPAPPESDDWRSWPLVSVRGQRFTGRDLISAGVVSGRWPRLEAELLAGAALREEHEVAPAERRQAERELRYARSLISADEFSGWAKAWGITLHDVRDALERQIVRDHASPSGRRPGGLPADARALAADTSAAPVEALLPEAVCSGALKDCATWLVDRVLVDGGGEPAQPPLRASPVDELRTRERELLTLADLDEDDDAARVRLAALVRADEAYEAHVAALCTPEAVAARVHRHRLDWVSFSLLGLACPTAAVAAEAALLLTEQDMSIADVAGLASLEPQRRRVELQTSSAALESRLVTARAGDVVGPIAQDGAHWLWVVQERRVPDAGDRRTAERAGAAIVEEDMHRRRAGAVQWTLPGGSW